MKILVDADACPVRKIIIKVAKEYKIPVMLYVDTSHVMKDDYAQIITVDKSRDSVDIALVNKVLKGDVVITQDYGLASMILPKGATVINQNGFIYSDENIDKLLFERHIGQKIRRAGGKTQGPRKRKQEDDIKFEELLRSVVSE